MTDKKFIKDFNLKIKKGEIPSFFVADITVKSEDETPTDDLFCKQ